MADGFGPTSSLDQETGGSKKGGSLTDLRFTFLPARMLEMNGMKQMQYKVGIVGHR